MRISPALQWMHRMTDFMSSSVGPSVQSSAMRVTMPTAVQPLLRLITSVHRSSSVRLLFTARKLSWVVRSLQKSRRSVCTVST